MGITFESNCLETIPKEFCIIGNAAGYLSNLIWFLVLFPQIVMNYKRKSVEGLSLPWAIANFTASECNLFFILRVHLPLFTRISGFYFVILEAFIIIQFVLYRKPFKDNFLWIGICAFMWLGLLLLELFLPVLTSYFAWVAIVLWSIETFPQLFLNMQRGTTDGQSTISLILVLVGKTSDFASSYSLKMPSQYVVMTYYSSTAAWINIIQLCFYQRRQRQEKESDTTPIEPHHLISMLLVLGMAVPVILIIMIAVALIVKEHSWIYIVCPISVAIVLAALYIMIVVQKQKEKPKYDQLQAKDEN